MASLLSRAVGTAARLLGVARAALDRDAAPENKEQAGSDDSTPSARRRRPLPSKDPDALEGALGLSFRDRGLLQLAFVHSSYVNENPGRFPESNERLEFLGDAVVGLAVAQELYRRHPGRSEGELTPMRSALVRGETLARIAASLRLGDYLVMGRGEEASGGRRRVSNLAATFEALVGALFLDQGYEAARDFVLRVLQRELAATDRRMVPNNPKSALQELAQRKGMGTPSYRVVETSGHDHARTFTAEVLVAGEVVGRGSGRRKAAAEQEAARAALKAIDPQL